MLSCRHHVKFPHPESHTCALRLSADLHDDAGIGLEQRDAIKKLVLAGDGHVGAAVDAWESGNRTVLQGTPGHAAKCAALHY